MFMELKVICLISCSTEEVAAEGSDDEAPASLLDLGDLGKVGKKKLAKLEAKAEKKAAREAEERERQERKEKELEMMKERKKQVSFWFKIWFIVSLNSIIHISGRARRANGERKRRTSEARGWRESS